MCKDTQQFFRRSFFLFLLWHEGRRAQCQHERGLPSVLQFRLGNGTTTCLSPVKALRITHFTPCFFFLFSGGRGEGAIGAVPLADGTKYRVNIKVNNYRKSLFNPGAACAQKVFYSLHPITLDKLTLCTITASCVNHLFKDSSL